MKPKLMPKLGYQETKDPPDQIILYIWPNIMKSYAILT